MKILKLASAIKYVNIASINLLFSGIDTAKKYLGKCHLEYYHQRKKGLPAIPFLVAFPKCDQTHSTVRIITENITGGLSITELLYISMLVNFYPLKTIFEIGTFDGCAAAQMVVNNQFRDSCAIHTLDLPCENINERDPSDHQKGPFLELRRPGYFIDHYTTDQVNQLFGDSLTFDFSPYYNSMDLVFIDGNHSMPFVQKDTENALKLLKPSGILLWHDYYGIPGDPVTDYLDNLPNSLSLFRIENTSLAVYKKNV